MALKNTLGDLNNHLFAQIERLSDEELTGEQLREEIERSKAVQGISSQIINNARVVLDAAKFNDDHWDADKKTPRMLSGDDNAKS